MSIIGTVACSCSRAISSNKKAVAGLSIRVITPQPVSSQPKTP